MPDTLDFVPEEPAQAEGIDFREEPESDILALPKGATLVKPKAPFTIQPTPKTFGEWFESSPVPTVEISPVTIPEGIAASVQKGAAGMLTPFSAAATALAPLRIARPVVAGMIGGLGAKGLGERIGQATVQPPRTLGEATELVGDIGLQAAMAGAPLGHIVLPETVRPKVQPPKELVTAATYTNPETGETTTGPNHPAAAAEQGVKAPGAREARETPEYGFQVEQPTGKTEVVSRDTAEEVARQSGQLKKEPKGEKVHSDEILSPTEPGKTISEQEQIPPKRFSLRTEPDRIDGVIQGEGGEITVRASTTEEPNGTHSVDHLMAFVPPKILDRVGLGEGAPRVVINLAEKIIGKTQQEARNKAYQALTDEINKGNFDIFKQPKEPPKQLPPPPLAKGVEAPPTLTPTESTRLKSLTDKLESGKKLTSAEQKRYRVLKDKVSPPEGEKPGVEAGADEPLPVTVQSLTADIRQALHRIELAKEEQKSLIPAGKRTKLNVAQSRKWNELQEKIDSTLSTVKLLESQRNQLRSPPTTPPSTGEGMVGPGARTVGEPPYRAIQQLTDQLEATPPGPAKERIPMRERLADAWGQGKTAWEKALGKMTAAKQSLKDTARGVRTPKDVDRRVGELDWSLQQSAAQSLQAGKALEKQMPNKAMREAVAIWVDAGGDENLIRNVLANLPEKTPKNVRRALEVASNLPPESRALAEQTKQFYGIRAQDGMSADVLHSVLDDYFTHTWKTEKNMPDDVRTAFSNGRLDTFFRNALERKIPMFLNGILQGKVPELDPVSVIPNYNYSMDRAIASRKFIKEISEMTEADGRPTVSPVGRQVKVGEPGAPPDEGALLIKPKARWEENGDYHYVDHPALRKWKWAGTDENGRTILYQSDLVVHPDAYDRISRMMDRGRLSPSKLTAAALRLSTEVKGFKLGVLSAFHTVHVGSHALFHWTDPIRAGITPIDWEAPNTRFAVEKGHLKLAPNPSELQHFAEGLLSPGLVHKIPLIGAWSKQFSEWNFGTYIPRLKMATFENGFARAKFMRDKMGLFKGLSDEELAARTGDSVNNAFGELNQLFLGKNGRAPEFQRLLRGIFLAPDFGEARLRFAEKAFTRYGHEERIALATMFGVFYTTARVANLVSTGDPQWEPKRAFQVKIGNHWWSMRSVIGDAWRAVSDFGKFLYPRLNPVYTRPIMDLIVGRDVMSGKKLTTFDKLVTRPIEQIVPIHLGGLTRDDQKVWESFAGSMGLAAIRDTPEMDMKRMAAKWLSDNGHPPTAEYLPTDTPTYAKLRQALAIGNDRNARKIISALKQTHEDKKIMDAMERYVNHPFTGSNEHEDEFVGQMSEPNLKLYQRAKEQRQKTLEDFYKIWFSIPKAKE